MNCLSRIDSIHLHNLHVPGRNPLSDGDRLFSCEISYKEDAVWVTHYESEEVRPADSTNCQQIRSSTDMEVQTQVAEDLSLHWDSMREMGASAAMPVSSAASSLAEQEPPNGGEELQLRVFCSSNHDKFVPAVHFLKSLAISSTNYTVAVLVADIFERVLATHKCSTEDGVGALRPERQRKDRDKIPVPISIESSKRYIFLELAFKLKDLVAIGEEIII